MILPPKVGLEKSRKIFFVFIMKLKLEDKLKIIELYEERFSISTLNKKYHVSYNKPYNFLIK